MPTLDDLLASPVVQSLLRQYRATDPNGPSVTADTLYNGVPRPQQAQTQVPTTIQRQISQDPETLRNFFGSIPGAAASAWSNPMGSGGFTPRPEAPTDAYGSIPAAAPDAGTPWYTKMVNALRGNEGAMMDAAGQPLLADDQGFPRAPQGAGPAAASAPSTGGGNLAPGGYWAPGVAENARIAAAGGMPTDAFGILAQSAQPKSPEQTAVDAYHATPGTVQDKVRAAAQAAVAGGAAGSGQVAIPAGFSAGQPSAATSSGGFRLPKGTWDALIRAGAGIMANADKPGLMPYGAGIQAANKELDALDTEKTRQQLEYLKYRSLNDSRIAELQAKIAQNQASNADKAELRRLMRDRLAFDIQHADTQTQLDQQKVEISRGNLAVNQQNAGTNAAARTTNAQTAADNSFTQAYSAAEKLYSGSTLAAMATPEQKNIDILSSLSTRYPDRPEVKAAMEAKRNQMAAMAAARKRPDQLEAINQRLQQNGIPPISLTQ